ncbi:MAG: NAD+ synthase [Micrococcales bacterium 73-13]|nr:MAG: NAD+ synthase [Micrococcales bacterium 73-13]
MSRARLALLQSNPVVGDIAGNAEQIVAAARRAVDAGADLLATGEMALTGYPIEDLAAEPSFLRAASDGVRALAGRLAAEGLGELPVVVGHPDGPHAPRLLGATNAPTAIAQNCASVLHRGEVVARYVKHHLPNYGVFDEYRNFIPEDDSLVVVAGDARVAVIICEDLWLDDGPVARVRDLGADLLLVVNASPFERDKDEVRLPLATRRAAEAGIPVAYVNLVGGQDDLVFDGDSFVVAPDGSLLARAPQFEEHLLVVDVPLHGTSVPAAAEPSLDEAGSPNRVAVLPDDREQLWSALVLGLRDYVEKNRFPSVVLGLSGGIDSSVCAAIAADAIGADRVHGVSMPSRWSSEHSRSDADDLAARIGLHYSVEPIAGLVQPFEEQLGLAGVAAENVQARARGVILMAKSNQRGHLVLTTGNKTELAVGYSTIYGDSAGGFAPIKDVPKTLVWELARWRNAAAQARGETPPIPESSIAKPPSAELRPDQTDQDTLPPYELLDEILDAYVSRRLGREDVVALGFDPETVRFVANLVDRAEWKRRQGAIGPRISGMAFGRDRRLPITVRRAPWVE